MADGYYCCVVETFFPSFFSAGLCGMHCRFSDTLSVTQYLFILCLVSWLAWSRRVFISRAMCALMFRQLLLCAGVGWSLRSLWERRWVWNKVGRSYSWRGYYFASVCCLPNCIILQVCVACPTVLFCKCVLPAQLYYFASVCCLPNCIILQVCVACPTPRLIPKGSNPVHPWEQHLWYVPYRDLAGYNIIIQSTLRYNVLRWRGKVFIQRCHLSCLQVYRPASF
jgi:hypothetical protein